MRTWMDRNSSIAGRFRPIGEARRQSARREFDLDQGTLRSEPRYSDDERYDRISMSSNRHEGADFAYHAGSERAEILRIRDLSGVYAIPFHQ